MNKKRLAELIGTVLLFLGMFYAFLPHAFHGQVSLASDAAHYSHVTYGMIGVIIGLGILVYSNKGLK